MKTQIVKVGRWGPKKVWKVVKSLNTVLTGPDDLKTAGEKAYIWVTKLFGDTNWTAGVARNLNFLGGLAKHEKLSRI